MATSVLSYCAAEECPALSEVFVQERWYAAYTCTNHEKRVAQQLAQREIEHFLPLYASVRRWKDRRVRLDLPLFPGYVFVRIPLKDRLQVLELPSVVRLVGFNGLPTALSDAEMDLLREGLSRQLLAEPHPYLRVGRRVRIRNGPLKGAEGILIRKKNMLRVVLSIDLIARSICVEIDAADIESILSRTSETLLDPASCIDGKKRGLRRARSESIR